MKQEQKPVALTRVNVIDSVYFQSPDVPTQDLDSRFSIPVVSEEQPVLRLMRLKNSDWTLLPLNGLEEVSQVFLKNEEGTKYDTVPTSEEVAAVKKRVVEINFYFTDDRHEENDLLILPGESCRFRPSKVSEVYVRCPVATPEKPVRLTIFLLPK